MIKDEISSDVVIFDRESLRKRHIKMYNNVTLEIADGIVDRVVSTNKSDIIKYYSLIGSKNSI